MRVSSLLLCFGIACMLGTARAQEARTRDWTWYTVDAQGSVRLDLYVFWSRNCRHCALALDFLESLKARHAWLDIHRYEITTSAANLNRYRQMAARLNQSAGQVPAFFYCKRLQIGYDSYQSNGRPIEQRLVRCREAIQRRLHRQAVLHSPELESPLARLVAMTVGIVSDAPATDREDAADADFPIDLPPEDETVNVPLWGEVGANDLSLPALTLVMASCDSFNPCAFFVLLFLLSLLIHSRSRPRMLLVGTVFVFFSGFMYFLFMAAWLNLFFVVGHLQFITAAAGLAAIIAALLNIKDFVWFKRGVSLSIPDAAKPGLFQRMTLLVNTKSLVPLLLGAACLAAVANLYELLCTSGFPLVYTRVLTLRELPLTSYYFYLVLYNVIYVVPLAFIVVGFTITLGRRKVTEYEGRVLKLLSGLMMFGLGLILLIRPEMLNTVSGAVGVLGAALGLTLLIVMLDRVRRHPRNGTEVRSAKLRTPPVEVSVPK